MYGVFFFKSLRSQTVWPTKVWFAVHILPRLYSGMSGDRFALELWLCGKKCKSQFSQGQFEFDLQGNILIGNNILYCWKALNGATFVSKIHCSARLSMWVVTMKHLPVYSAICWVCLLDWMIEVRRNETYGHLTSWDLSSMWRNRTLPQQPGTTWSYWSAAVSVALLWQRNNWADTNVFSFCATFIYIYVPTHNLLPFYKFI